MKQKVAVRTLITYDHKTLLVRRASGRPSILGLYELPGGKIDYNEQPEDALKRHLKNDLGVEIGGRQLFDVLTYVDKDDSDVQYVFLLYLVTAKNRHVSLSESYDHYMWQKISDLRRNQITDSTHLLIGLSQGFVESGSSLSPEGSERASLPVQADFAIIYSDGGSRGNPGPSASGFVIMDSQEQILYEGGVYLGITTNNQAEYHGVRLGLEKALELGIKTVEFRVDSLLVANQMNGIFKIKNRELWPIHERIHELAAQFDKVSFSHVRREFNQLADAMVNKVLDEKAHRAV